MFKRPVFPVLVSCLLAAAAIGATEVVTLKTGRKITGEVTKTADGYEVKTKLGVIVFAAEQVASIEEFISPDLEYEQRRAKMDPKTAADHLALGQWAFGKGLLEISRKELKAALALKADYEKARALLKQVEARIKATGTSTGGNGPKTVPRTTDVGVGPRVKPTWLVPMEDVYKIRMAEFSGDPEKEKVRVSFRNDVVKRFVNSMRGKNDFKDPNAERQFLGISPLRKARYMIQKTSRDSTRIRDDILINSDPRFMISFRRGVWPIVAQHCATAQCHGGEKPKGGLKLFKIAANVKVDYTNFVLLDGFLSRGWRLVDRSNPEKSLLLEYGLPKAQAQKKHPTKTVPAFSSRKASGYKRVLKWIEDELNGPRHPDYRVKYQPPLGMKIYGKAEPSSPKGPTTKPVD